LAIVLAAASAAAVAQDQTSQTDIRAGQVRETTIERSYSDIPMEQYQVDRTVSYANLDLSKASDAAELKKRVREAAREDCKELTSADPLDMSGSNTACVRDATDSAMAQVNAAIDAAKVR
jgi:UrcA family protein